MKASYVIALIVVLMIIVQNVSAYATNDTSPIQLAVDGIVAQLEKE
jgi:hypothetical protein